MYDLAEKIVNLRIALRRATMCENIDGNNKKTLSLKTKTLFLIQNGSVTPNEILETLLLSKPNVTALTNNLEEENLIEKKRNCYDKREIVYDLTPKGKDYLNKRLKYIEDNFNKIIDEDEKYNNTISKIAEIIDLISFL